MSSAWYVIRTKPRVEPDAYRALTLDGIEVYFPRISSPDHRKRQDVPMFPGYLFIQLDLESSNWPTFRHLHQVVGLVSFGEVVPSIPEESMVELKDLVDSVNGENGLWRRFKVGETVRVDSGAFQGLAEIIQEAKSPRARALVLLQFMGRLVQTRVPWMDLQPRADYAGTLKSIEKVRLPRRTRGRGRQVHTGGSWVPATQ